MTGKVGLGVGVYNIKVHTEMLGSGFLTYITIAACFVFPSDTVGTPPPCIGSTPPSKTKIVLAADCRAWQLLGLHFGCRAAGSGSRFSLVRQRVLIVTGRNIRGHREFWSRMTKPDFEAPMNHSHFRPPISKKWQIAK